MENDKNEKDIKLVREGQKELDTLLELEADGEQYKKVCLRIGQRQRARGIGRGTFRYSSIDQVGMLYNTSTYEPHSKLRGNCAYCDCWNYWSAKIVQFVNANPNSS